MQSFASRWCGRGLLPSYRNLVMQKDDTPLGRYIWEEYEKALIVKIITFDDWFFEVLEIVVA